MARTAKKDKPAKKKLTRRVLTLLEKKEIIASIESGKSQSDVAREWDTNRSTIGTIWARREKIVEAAETAAAGMTKVEDITRRPPCFNEMEKCLYQWVKEMQMRGNPLRQSDIMSKAMRIWNDLTEGNPDYVPATLLVGGKKPVVPPGDKRHRFLGEYKSI